MKDILIIAHFISTENEKGNSRFTYLADLLVENNNKVEIVTSSFSHINKEQRLDNIGQREDEKYKLTFLKEPGYKKNVSLSRFYSHFILGKNLKRYLKNRKKPDVIYCAIPSLDIAYAAAKYAKKNKIKFIVDVQDLWPEAFKMVFKIPVFTDIVFKPMELLANYTYNMADEIVAVSETYCDRAVKVNKKVKQGTSVFLGTDLSYFDKCTSSERLDKSKDEIWLSYVGTLSHSYNIKLVIDALKQVRYKGIKNVNFIVMGDGQLKDKFEEYAKEQGVNAIFTGRLEYPEMVSYLKKSDIAVNPIVKGSAGSIINKVGDYAAAGLPVLNTQESTEYRSLIDKYNCGINCDTESIEDLCKNIINLCNNTELRLKLGKNNRRLAEEKFDRNNIYKSILKII